MLWSRVSLNPVNLQWLVLIPWVSLKKWKTLHRSWRKKWGIGRRVKGCPPPTPCGLHDYKLWRVGSGRGFPPSASQNKTYSNWSCNDATIKVANVGQSIPSMARYPQNLNAVGNPDVWWSKDVNSTGGLRHVYVLLRSLVPWVLANDNNLGTISITWA